MDLLRLGRHLSKSLRLQPHTNPTKTAREICKLFTLEFDSQPRLQTLSFVGRDALRLRVSEISGWAIDTMTTMAWSSRDVSRLAAVVLRGDVEAAVPRSSDAGSSCRHRHLCCPSIVFRRAISTSLRSRCPLRVIPKRSGLSYSVSCSHAACRASSGYTSPLYV
jgi:hypothetical protein